MEPSSAWLPRVQLLMQQNRLAMAADELRRQLARNPHEPIAHTLLALCLLDLDNATEAQEEAEVAIHLAPEYSLAFYALALARHRQHRPKEALEAINQALALDPADADYYHLLGNLRLESNQWQAALQATSTGLNFDAEHAGLHSLQARALARQGRSREAAQSAHEALGYGSESSSIQAQAGYVALETNRSKEALGHFQEALRLDPTSEYARAGLVEALKARYWVYRTFMRFMYWTASLGKGLRQGLFLGAWLVAQFVRPLLPIYLVFAYMSWFNNVLFESLLRFNRYGRLALSDAQRRHSNHFLGLLAVAAAAGGTALAMPAVPGPLTLCFVALGLLFPLVGTERLGYRPEQQARSRWAGWALAASGLLSVALEVAGVDSASNLLFMVFLYGTVAYTWIFALGR